MSRLLCTADLHLTDKRQHEYRHEFIGRDLVDIAQRRKPDAIAILGDLTEVKDNHSAKLVNRIVGHMTALAAIAPTLVMMGNHDYHNEGEAFFAFLREIPNLTWVDRVCDASQLPVKFRKPFDGCLFLPHTRNYEEDWRDIKFKNYKTIFAHNTFNGAGVGFGRQLDGIPLDVFPAKANVIAGDIHVPQCLGPVTYIGAPYTIDFGDDYEPRLLAIDGDGPHTVSVKSFPQRRLVHVAELKQLDKVLGIKEGDILKIRIDVDDMATWAATHKAAIAWATDNGMKAEAVEPIVQKHVTRKRVKINAKQSDTELLGQFARRHSVPDRTLEMGIVIIEELGQ